MKLFLLSLFLMLLQENTLLSQRKFKTEQLTPFITTQWNISNPKIKIHRLQDKNLRYFPLFKTFDYDYLQQHALPDTRISFRNNPQKGIKGSYLKKLIERFFKEVRMGYTSFTDFTILKKKDFNIRKQAGLIIVKSKKYPFVIKLFMETPRSFIRPYNKGFEPACQWILGGGITRHLLGFTRIKNSISVKDELKTNPYWNNMIDVPRKWFWLPTDYPWILLNGYNIGMHKQASISLPGAYVVIADAIESERELHLFNKNDRMLAINLSNFLIGRIDPHINNFLFERETKKLIIIDTEHFPTMGGFKKPEKLYSYGSYYLKLMGKCLKNGFFSTKKERMLLAQNDTPFSLP